MFVVFCIYNLATAGACQPVERQVSEEVTTQQSCFAVAQPQIAQWKERHPNVRIGHFTCLDAERLRRLRVRGI